MLLDRGVCTGYEGEEAFCLLRFLFFLPFFPSFSSLFHGVWRLRGFFKPLFQRRSDENGQISKATFSKIKRDLFVTEYLFTN